MTSTPFQGGIIYLEKSKLLVIIEGNIVYFAIQYTCYLKRVKKGQVPKKGRVG